MAWAEVGSGTQRATQGGGSAPSWTKAFPGDVTSGSLVVGGGTVWRSGNVGQIDLVVTDTVGTAYTVVYGDVYLQGDGEGGPFLFYGFTPTAGANTVEVATADTVAAYIGFSIDEFSGIDPLTPLSATGRDYASYVGDTGTSATVSGVTLDWTIGAARSWFAKALAFRPDGGGAALILGVFAYVYPVTTIAVDAPATQIGEEEDAATKGEHSFAFLTGSSTVPVAYEDPCSIVDPRIFTKIATGSETLKYGVHPLRDTAALGGFAEPRLIDVSPVTKAASDPASGAWSAQTASTRFADTDRAVRAKSETRVGFRGCTQEIYLTSNARRLAGLPPRVLFSGIVNADAQDEHLVTSTSINDLIGNDYTLFADEKQIPQRQIAITHFPNAPKDALGRGEPILGGRLAPANPANGEGVVDGIYCGQILDDRAPGTPDAGTLADLVNDMQAAADDGELDEQFGDRLGHADCQAYEHQTIPSSEAALKAAFGTGDIDAILDDYAASGSGSVLAVLFAGHAVKEVLDGRNGDPSIWINEEQIDPSEIGNSVWIETSYDIVGTNGETRRYFLLLFDPSSAYGEEVAAGGRVHLDCLGIEDVGDGSGTALTDYFDLYRHVLINFLLQNYLSGAWLTVPQFLFSDGVTLLDRVDEGSFDAAAAIAAVYHSGGYLGGFKIGDRTSIRTVIQNFNASVGCELGQDDFGRLFVKLLNPSRSAFLTNRDTLHRILRDKVDFLPGFRIEAKPDWQVNRLFYQYAQNYYLSQYERGEGAGGIAPVEYTAGQATDGIITKTFQLPYVRDDGTALAVAEYYVALFGPLPRVVSYARRGLCGLEDDVLDGVPITHYNGYGATGWEDHAVWILTKTFDPKRMVASFTALDVDGLVS